MPDDRYTHGHHQSVLRSHAWRTAANSAAYLLPRLEPGLDLLDVGCGPGTITRDLARLVAPGRVVGIDRSAEVIAQAAALAAGEHVEFAVGDVYALSYEDRSFDVAHAHQVLQHLSDPVAALRELRRVLRPAGVLAVRDADYAGFVWAPADPALESWMSLYHQVTSRNGAQADAGRHLLSWVRRAGFEDAVMTSSTWTFADADARSWWGGTLAERATSSSFAEQAVEYGLCDEGELERIAAAFRRWVAAEDGCFVALHCEVLATRSP